MKTLPRNISAHPDGFIIRVVRLGVRYQAFTTKLERAIELRDRFYRIVGEVENTKIRGPHRRGHSNTGIPGISETTHWAHDIPHPCFTVHFRQLRPDGTTRGNNRRFYFGPRAECSSRERALQEAIDFRDRTALKPQLTT